MEVELLEVTPNAEEVCAIAMRSCHTPEPGHNVSMDDPMIEKMIIAAKKVKHFSVLEHANFTFSVGGVSRALTHQLVRHRLASYSQQSQRYVKMKEPTYVTPPSINEIASRSHPTVPNATVVHVWFHRAMEQAWETYNTLVDEGVPPEDARFVLPNACTTNIVITMNARELLHFFRLRTSKHAQWEIRALANKMLDLCQEVAPIIFRGNPEEWE